MQNKINSEEYRVGNKIMKYIIYIVILLLFVSCSAMSDIDKIIAQYDNIDSDILKNRVIFQRQKNVYFISVYKSVSAIYVVEIYENDSIKDIIKPYHCIQQDTLTIEDIKKSMNYFLKYKIPMIIVDSLSNLYINPYKSDEPILLKKVSNKLPLSVNTLNYKSFKHYKSNWYYNDFYFNNKGNRK